MTPGKHTPDHPTATLARTPTLALSTPTNTMSSSGPANKPLVEQPPTKKTGGLQNDYVNSVEHQITQIKQFVKTTHEKIPSYSMTLAELSSLLLSEHDESTILLDTPIVWRTLRMLHDAQPFMKFCKCPDATLQSFCSVEQSSNRYSRHRRL